MNHPFLKTAAGIIGVAGAGVLVWLVLANRNPDLATPSVPVADQAAQIVRGAYLARVGNCQSCHTMRGGTPFAGGRVVPTPFGNIYAPNLTSDAATGIGRWSSDDFWRAMHDGKSRDGSLLYPAFPFTNYTRVSRADSDAIYAYFRTIPAVKRENTPNELRFPFNIRWLLYGWRALYFTPGAYVADNRQSVDWNRGAYLVRGLGHCSACHSPRDLAGGTSLNAELGGGMIPVLNWYAPPLNGDLANGLGRWQQQHLAALLKTGVAPKAAVSGPMAEVVGTSLQHLTDTDIDAMAVYVKSLPQQAPPPAEAAEQVTPERKKEVLAIGAGLYENHCVACHQANGQGVAGVYPALAGSAAVMMNGGSNAIHLVLNGGYAPSTAGNPRPYGMPPFGQALGDADLANLLSYVRNSWGNAGNLVSQVEVNRYRSKQGD